EALRYFEQALAIQPRHAGIMASKAELLILFGQLGEAQSVLDTALRLEPQNPEALCLLAKLQKTAPDSPAFAVLEDALSTATPSRQKVIHFALGKMYDETGRYALAFAHYQAGNALRRAKSGPYDAARDVAWLNIVQQMFPAEIFASLAEAGAPSRRPIFVFGMPRSGTTLVEQILASHAEVFGAGELEYFGKALGQLGEEKNGIRMVDARRPLQAEDIARVAQGYLDLLARLDATAKRVVDKMPHNFEFLGLMALCYPQATFLHIERDPLDTCLSCYFQDFSQKRHGYSDDLIDLGRHYLYYRAMMDYWHSVLPVPIHRVRYEALVSEPEQQIPQLLALCGLTMDENCLAPHRTERVVCTASRVQVREPIHRSSVQKWRRYEQELEPLVAVLRQGGVYV
ncbi:MAG: sulfotransferase, partial [Aggregatilineaceae bacterium]